MGQPPVIMLFGLTNENKAAAGIEGGAVGTAGEVCPDGSGPVVLRPGADVAACLVGRGRQLAIGRRRTRQRRGEPSGCYCPGMVPRQDPMARQKRARWRMSVIVAVNGGCRNQWCGQAVVSRLGLGP